MFEVESVCSIGIYTGTFREVNSRIVHQESEAHLVLCFQTTLKQSNKQL